MGAVDRARHRRRLSRRLHRPNFWLLRGGPTYWLLVRGARRRLAAVRLSRSARYSRLGLISELFLFEIRQSLPHGADILELTMNSILSVLMITAPLVGACAATLPPPTQRLADAQSSERSAREVGANKVP